MKKRILLILLVSGCNLSAFAQEKKMNVGLGVEWNMASRHNFAGGAVINAIYNLPASTALGLSLTASTNFNKINVLEPAFLVRHYFSPDAYSAFFVQFDIGAFIALEEEGVTPMIMSGLAAGYRLPVKKTFYIEPYGRLGYPFAFGLGVMGGICF